MGDLINEIFGIGSEMNELAKHSKVKYPFNEIIVF